MTIAWLLVFFAGTDVVTVPYPYSTKEACAEAMQEAAGENATEGKYVCIRVEVTPSTDRGE